MPYGFLGFGENKTETTEELLDELFGLDDIVGYAVLPDTGGTVEAVVDYSDPVDLIDSERAAVAVVYDDDRPIKTILAKHTIQEGTSETVTGIPASGGALVIACSDSSVSASITLSQSAAAVIKARARQAAEDRDTSPAWLKSVESVMGSASKAIIALCIVGGLAYLAVQIAPVAAAVKGAAR